MHNQIPLMIDESSPGRADYRSAMWRTDHVVKLSFVKYANKYTNKKCKFNMNYIDKSLHLCLFYNSTFLINPINAKSFSSLDLCIFI